MILFVRRLNFFYKLIFPVSFKIENSEFYECEGSWDCWYEKWSKDDLCQAQIPSLHKWPTLRAIIVALDTEVVIGNMVWSVSESSYADDANHKNIS